MTLKKQRESFQGRGDEPQWILKEKKNMVSTPRKKDCVKLSKDANNIGGRLAGVLEAFMKRKRSCVNNGDLSGKFLQSGHWPVQVSTLLFFFPRFSPGQLHCYPLILSWACSRAPVIQEWKQRESGKPQKEAMEVQKERPGMFFWKW